MPDNIIDPNEDFEGHFAQQLAKQRGEASPAESEAPVKPSDPAQDSAEDIVAAMADPGLTLSVESGLEIPGEKKEPEVPAPTPAPDPKVVAERDTAVQQLRGLEATVEALSEIGDLRNFEIDTDLTPEQLVVIREMAEADPEAFAELVEQLDNRDEEDALEYDPEADLDALFPEGFTGQRLAALVGDTSMYLRQLFAEEERAEQEHKLREGRLQAIYEHYRAAGLNDPAEIASRYEVDRHFLQQIGHDPDQMNPEQLRAALVLPEAASRELEREQRLDRFHASFFDGQSTEIEAGMTVLQNGQHVPVQPKPDFGNSPDFAKRMVERARQMSAQPKQPVTQAQIQDVFLKPERTSIRDGWEKDGKPYDLEGERAKKAREKEAQEYRERAAELGLR